jgi:hypothetical protein
MLLREDERDCEAQCGGVGGIGAYGVVVVLEAQRHGLTVEDECAADSAASGNGPALATRGIPVGGDAGGGGEGPAFAEVVVNEVLPEQEIGPWGTVGVCHWRELDKERAKDEGAGSCQYDYGWPCCPGASFGWVCGGSGEGEGWANAPDDLSGMSWGEESLCLNIAYSAVADAVACRDAVNWHDRSGNEGPVWSDVDGYDGLEVQIEEGLVLIGSAAIEVELKGYGHDVADGVLCLLGQGGCVGFCWGWWGSGCLRPEH